jgi:hypothetical protein
LSMVIGTNSDSTHTSSCAVYERPLRGNHFKAITDRTWPNWAPQLILGLSFVRPAMSFGHWHLDLDKP